MLFNICYGGDFFALRSIAMVELLGSHAAISHPYYKLGTEPSID